MDIPSLFSVRNSVYRIINLGNLAQQRRVKRSISLNNISLNIVRISLNDRNINKINCLD